MFKLVVVGIVAALATAHPVSQEMVEKIKKTQTTWTPMEVEENPLKNHSPEELLFKLGTYIVDVNGDYSEGEIVETPANFDSRTQWPGWVHPVRNQEQCGSCWAFGASEAMSDRVTIASQGKIDVVLSPEDMVSCDSTDEGCGGGYMENAWKYLESSGIVSDSCFPYTAGSGTEAKCVSSCVNGEDWKKYKCKKGSIVHPTTVEGIKSEMFKNGPMESAFTVYNDFFNYKSGVYVPDTSSGVAGGHAIKCIGYGNEAGNDYWLCVNSWG
jgi:cathepsin B